MFMTLFLFVLINSYFDVFYWVPAITIAIIIIIAFHLKRFPLSKGWSSVSRILFYFIFIDILPPSLGFIFSLMLCLW